MDNNEQWKKALEFFEARFGSDLDMDGLLFLIGLQEVGKGKQKLSKDEKLDIMHVAVCTLLEPYGFYEYKGRDEDGWPHFDRKNKLPHLKPGEQHRLIRDAVVHYVDNQKESPLYATGDGKAHL